MNATNRKIDNKADPANDPAMAALRGNNRLQFLMEEIRLENPIGKPDRPHPPVTDLRTATSLETQREELQRAISPEAQKQTASATPVPAPTAVEETVTPRGPALAVEAKGELPQEVPQPETAPKSEEAILPPPPVSDPATQKTDNLPVNDAAVHADSLQAKPRLRGRPRVSDEKKRESSYTLSPHVADRVRDLAAHEQIRLKRTVSASAIVERMIEIAEQHIQDNKVLPG
ncbi:hypothetical protein [Rhizobium sp. MHM7A]|uniref:hypothetical protein n=1 Tax=Rhizobium sp. MHM7A TaxID=2583233 RepID=UPI001106578B|nr:hypothetical protein [Rhizobium sp. MHM7A]TLX16892.1 hypothetical protein FFR93_05975 [Rhizobium sp. MHM7A]